MKILIIAIRYKPNNTMTVNYDYNMPVGLAYISSVLKKDGYEVRCLNLNHCDGSDSDVIRKILLQEKFDFVLTGGLSVFYPVIKSCIETVRKYAAYAKIILGGGAISSQPGLTFKLLEPDYIAIGEGELTISELLSCLGNAGDPASVRGIGYCGPDGQFKLTQPREAIRDLDSLPYPDYEGLGYDDYLDHMLASDNGPYYDLVDHPRTYPLISSRSCPFSCSFCFHPIGNIYRQRSIQNIMDEIKFAANRYKINIISIYDELFSYNKERVYEFCKQIRQLSQTLPWEIKWNCQMRVDKLDEDLLRTMKEAGCYILSLGLESYSIDVLKSMQKKITPQQIDHALQMTRRLNISIQGNFIFGDAAETLETVNETLNYWGKSVYSGGGLNLAFIQPYPGTALYKHCLTKGIIKDETDFLENITTRIAKPINMSNSMTLKEFEKLQIDVYEAERKYHKCVKPLSVIQNNGIDEVQVKCPYCNTISTYKNYIYDKYSYGEQHICCRNCRMRFYLVSRILEFEILFNKFFGAGITLYIRNIAQHILKTIRSAKRRYNILLTDIRFKKE